MLQKENNPWLGLASYEYKDAYRFFGREEELAELKAAICNNPFTTIYGISGAGKTSLINAGMIPMLESENFLPVRIRLEHQSSTGYNTQIIQAITEAIAKNGGEIEKRSQLDVDDMEEEALWNFLFSSRFWSKTNHQLMPVVFIDQFEEIFTKNESNDKAIQQFFDAINSLQYNTPPAKTSELLEQQQQYVDFNDSALFRMVFIMREDFLARLEDYSFNIPALRKNRKGIKRMNGNQALDVILRPSPDIVTRDIALQILSKVTGKEVQDSEYVLNRLSVDTSILSLFCSELYQKAVDGKLDVLTTELVNQFGDDIISSFYDETMKMVSPKTMEYLESHLLTFSGYRNSVALEDLLQNGIKQEELDKLSSKRLIRIEASESTERVEFTHDVLCKVAKEHRNKRNEKTNSRISLLRNLGFAVDTTAITLMLGFVLFLFFGSGRMYRIFNHWEVLLAALLSYLLLPYRHSRDKNTKWIILSLMILYAFIFYNSLHLQEANTDGIILSLSFVLILPVIRLIQSFRYTEKRPILTTIRNAFTGSVYSQYSFFGHYLGWLAILMIVPVLLIVWASLHDMATLVFTPILSLAFLFIILYERHILPKKKMSALIMALVSTAVTEAILLAQYICYHVVIIGVLSIVLLCMTIWYLRRCDMEHIYLSFIPKSIREEKGRQVTLYCYALALWAVSFVLIPYKTIGYNVLSEDGYARIYRGTILNGNEWDSHPFYRFLTVRNADGLVGVRDRHSIVVPSKFSEIDHYVYLNVAERNRSIEGLFLGKYDYSYYYDADIRFSCKDSSGIVCWKCADHLDMDNLCTRLILRNYRGCYSRSAELKYINHLCQYRKDLSQKEIEDEIAQIFVDAYNSNEQSYHLEPYSSVKIKSLDDLKKKDNFGKSNFERIRYLIPLLAFDKSHQLSHLLLDSIIVKHKDTFSKQDYHVSQSYYHLFARDFKTAEKEALTALKYYPDEAIAYTNLFSALLFQNREEEAFRVFSNHKNDLYSTDYDEGDLQFRYVGMGCQSDFQTFTECGLINDLSASLQQRLADSLQTYQLPEELFSYVRFGELYQVGDGKNSENYLMFQGYDDATMLYHDGKALTPPARLAISYSEGNIWSDSVAVIVFPLDIEKKMTAWGTDYEIKPSDKRYFMMLNASGHPHPIPGEFSHAWLFSEGMAAVDVDGKIGFIDMKGQYVIPPTFSYDYDQAKPDDIVDFVFHDGYCPMVASPGHHGLIDKRGNWVIAPEYTYINHPVEGYRIIRKDNQYGLLDSKLKMVLPIEHSWINQDKVSRTITIDAVEYSYPELRALIQESITKNR